MGAPIVLICHMIVLEYASATEQYSRPGLFLWRVCVCVCVWARAKQAREIACWTSKIEHIRRGARREMGRTSHLAHLADRRHLVRVAQVQRVVRDRLRTHTRRSLLTL